MREKIIIFFALLLHALDIAVDFERDFNFFFTLYSSCLRPNWQISSTFNLSNYNYG